MAEQQDQAKPVAKDAESLTLWLPASAIKDLNELVGWRTTRDRLATRSSIVLEMIQRDHRKEQAARGKR